MAYISKFTYRTTDGRIITDTNAKKGIDRLLDPIEVEISGMHDYLWWEEEGEEVLVHCQDVYGFRDDSGYCYFSKANREWRKTGGNELMIVNNLVYSLAPSGDGYDFICVADDDIFRDYADGLPLDCTEPDYDFPANIFQVYTNGDPTGVFTVQ